MPDFERVVEFASDGGGSRREIRRNDFIKITAPGDDPGSWVTAYLTRGRLETEDGAVIDPVPPWAAEIIENQLSPAALASVGYTSVTATEEEDATPFMPPATRRKRPSPEPPPEPTILESEEDSDE